MLSKYRREEIISRFLNCSPTLAEDYEIRNCLLAIERVYGIGHAVECEWAIKKVRSQSYLNTDLIEFPSWISLRNDKQKLDVQVSEEISDRKEFFDRKDQEFKPDVLKKDSGILEKLSNVSHRIFSLNF